MKGIYEDCSIRLRNSVNKNLSDMKKQASKGAEAKWGVKAAFVVPVIVAALLLAVAQSRAGLGHAVSGDNQVRVAVDENIISMRSVEREYTFSNSQQHTELDSFIERDTGDEDVLELEECERHEEAHPEADVDSFVGYEIDSEEISGAEDEEIDDEAHLDVMAEHAAVEEATEEAHETDIHLDSFIERDIGEEEVLEPEE
eukprot:CAMPEP_0198728148 /NCGR_PEP_ID=MMETSP1475-20131203/7326_1 /TAXON_ID= ORGANISM="Unidentified sp., Strain CCMP1999" /NCGR_SAMPLE_ID=MMETSP1475 /ASSEMBLY_ACC=CAM_ASM_001111 /LENGTH=199 /DNA_ID=CAMNT_0044490429 /DNA_START=30 /DNA_END=626 /DNA_ORIENTATION=-